MRYMLLLYTNHATWESFSPAEQEAWIKEHFDLIHELEQSGKYKTSDGLKPPQTATTVRVRSGKTMVTDGPFAESKEHLGGYYMIEASNLDEAIAIAARIPDARVGSIEVRPVQEFDR